MSIRLNVMLQMMRVSRKAFETIKDYAGEIHGVVHAVAYANKDDLFR